MTAVALEPACRAWRSTRPGAITWSTAGAAGLVTRGLIAVGFHHAGMCGRTSFVTAHVQNLGSGTPCGLESRRPCYAAATRTSPTRLLACGRSATLARALQVRTGAPSAPQDGLDEGRLAGYVPLPVRAVSLGQLTFEARVFSRRLRVRAQVIPD